MFHRFATQTGLVAILCCLPGTAPAQQVSTSPQYTLQHWDAGTADDGLPQNTVTAIVQTQDGYLWIGTYTGLARFDGVRFTIFDDDNSPGLANSRITALFEDAEATLWIGHETGEVSRYRAGRFESVPVTAPWSGGKIQDLATDAKGDVWLLNADGLLARLRDGLVLTPESGTASKVFELTRSPRGQIWVGRNGRISALREEKLVPLPFSEASQNNYVWAMGAGRDEGLWLGIGEQIRKWQNNAWSPEVRISPWGMQTTHKLLETRAGELVLSASAVGFALVHRGTESPLLFSRSNGFTSDWVISLCEDREENLWVGTGGAGLAVLRPGVLQTITPPDQWLGRAVLSVHPGPKDSLWIGTEGAGLYHYHNQQWTNFAENAGLKNSYVWSLLQDPEKLQVGTWNGLFVQSGAGFVAAPGLENMTAPVTALHRSREGGTWLGTGAGLLHYAAGKSFRVAPGAEAIKPDVRTIAVADDGAVWFGTAGTGLGRLVNNRVQWFRKADGLASDYIGCLLVESNGTVWVGTLGGGLSRFKNGRFTTIAHEHGLPNGYINHIEDDGRGFFWMSSNNGIFRVAKAGLHACADGGAGSLHFRTYGISDGMPTLICSSGLQAAGCKTSDGRLWFTTSRGLIAVNPANVRTNHLPPPVVIEHLLVDEKIVPFAQDATRPQQIPPGRHRIEFQYTGLSFIGSERLQFKHRLHNWESDWVDSGIKRAINYNYLPPGEYRFEVAARNNDGIWSDKHAVVAFRVQPYFWQTLTFRIAAGGLLVAGAAGLVWFDTRRRMRRKLEKLERQRAIENERARIAKDIHDDLGSTLTRITMLSDPLRGAAEEASTTTAENLNQIHSTTRELTRSMDEIVWAINPQHDTLDSLLAYLESFAQDFLGTARVRCRLDMPLQLPVLPLSAEARHNLFLAFKEALHNVVKHAHATEVRIAVELTPTAFTVAVEDNGRGFSPAEVARTSFGNGLANMQRRLAKIGGRCEIAPVPPGGTRVIFTVYLPPAVSNI